MDEEILNLCTFIHENGLYCSKDTYSEIPYNTLDYFRYHCVVSLLKPKVRSKDSYLHDHLFPSPTGGCGFCLI